MFLLSLCSTADALYPELSFCPNPPRNDYGPAPYDISTVAFLSLLSSKIFRVSLSRFLFVRCLSSRVVFLSTLSDICSSADLSAPVSKAFSVSPFLNPFSSRSFVPRRQSLLNPPRLEHGHGPCDHGLGVAGVGRYSLPS